MKKFLLTFAFASLSAISFVNASHSFSESTAQGNVPEYDASITTPPIERRHSKGIPKPVATLWPSSYTHNVLGFINGLSLFSLGYGAINRDWLVAGCMVASYVGSNCLNAILHKDVNDTISIISAAFGYSLYKHTQSCLTGIGVGVLGKVAQNYGYLPYSKLFRKYTSY